MDKKNLMPIAAQPVNRLSTGQLPAELAELSEEALQQHGEGTLYSTSVLASGWPNETRGAGEFLVFL